MAEQVTRKFTNKTDGTPRTGLNLRLISLTAPSSDPLPFVEVVTTVEADQGQYYVAAPGGTTITQVPHGVYQIQRDVGAGYVDFEGMITVEPGRVEGLEANKFPLLDRVNTAITQVSSFMSDTEQGTLAVIQRALDYAATTTKHVKVGAWGPAGENVIWTGSPITVPAGVTLDLCGATLYADSANDLPVLTIPGNACIMNGSLKTKFASGSRVATVGESSFHVVFLNVDFIVGNSAYPTAADTVNLEMLVTFVSCTDVILAPKTSTSDTRAQVDIGCYPVFEVGGSVHVGGASHANAYGKDLGGLVRIGLGAMGTAPDTTAPFADMKEFAEAVKHYWFTDKAATAARIDGIDATALRDTFTWTGAIGPDDPNGDPTMLNYSLTLAAGGTTPSPTKINLQRKATVYGQGLYKRLRISAAGTVKLSNMASSITQWDSEYQIDFTDLQAALRVAYPNCGDLFSYVKPSSPTYADLDDLSGSLVSFKVLARNSSGTIMDMAMATGNEAQRIYASPGVIKIKTARFSITLGSPGYITTQFSFELDYPFNDIDGSSSLSSGWASLDGLPYEAL